MIVVIHCDLEADIEASLCFRYTSYLGNNQTKTLEILLDNETNENILITDELGNEWHLTIFNIDLSSYLPQGTYVEKEVNCNSAFMAQHLPSIGEEILKKMPWVPREEIIYLVMDNAGGHGTQNANHEYTRVMLDTHTMLQ